MQTRVRTRGVFSQVNRLHPVPAHREESSLHRKPTKGYCCCPTRLAAGAGAGDAHRCGPPHAPTTRTKKRINSAVTRRKKRGRRSLATPGPRGPRARLWRPSIHGLSPSQEARPTATGKENGRLRCLLPVYSQKSVGDGVPSDDCPCLHGAALVGPSF